MKKTLIFFVSIIVLFLIVSVFLNPNINFLKLKAAVPTSTDRLHFIYADSYDESTSSEAILIESKGNYGLIDTGNPSGDPSPYNVHDLPFNGAKVYNYLHKAGVSKLKFVILTHGHSDHVGGVKYLVSKGLIDSNTTVIYRNYSNTRQEEVDWYSSHYWDDAMTAINSSNAKKLEISDVSASNLNKINATYTNTGKAATNNISFNFGNYNIKLMNIGSYGSGDPENRKSIVTLITKGKQKALLMSESINHNNVINTIGDYVGKVDFAKIGHYYGNKGSIPLHFLNTINPEKAIITGKLTASNTSATNDYGLAIAYFNETGKLLVGNEDTGLPKVAVFDSSEIKLYTNNSGSYTELNSITKKTTLKKGWLQIYDTSTSYSWVHINSSNKLSKGFNTISDSIYYLNETTTSAVSAGVMAKGWKKVGGYWYYLNPTETTTYKEGELVTGWLKLDNVWYFLDKNSSPSGKMATGFRKISNKWYYFKDSGAMATSNVTINGKTFKIGTDGVVSGFNGKVTIPTAANYCIPATYSGSYQTIVKGAPTGATFTNTGATSAVSITVTASLSTGYAWSDSTAGSKTFVCSISPKNLSSSTITVSGQTYTGKALTPLPTVKDGTKTLVKDTDYTVSYSNNVNVGTGTVTVTGKGNYTGTKITTFAINPIKVAIPTAANYCIPATYTGTYQTIVKSAPTGVTFINTGATDAVSITVTANLNTGYAWSDSTTGIKQFLCTISKKDISSSTVTISDQKYTGSALTPPPTVFDGTKGLTLNTDYTVTYKNNINIGTATATITGKGNYTGTKIATFNITTSIVKVDKPTANYCTNAIYDGSNQTITINPGTGYTFSGNTGTNAGTYTVTAKLKSDYQWKDGTTSDVTFNCPINAKNISGSTISVSDQTYTGSALTPLPTIKDGTKTLVKDTDYAVTYSNNINVGTATLTVTGKGNYTGTKQASFKINSSVIQIEKPTTAFCKNPTYNGSNQTITINPGTGYTFSGNTGIDAGTYTVTAKLKSGYQWKDGTTENVVVECPIYQKNIKYTDISILSQVYDGTEKTPLPTINDGAKTLVKDTDYTVGTYINNIEVGIATVSITGIGNYTGTLEEQFVIIEPDTSFYIIDSSYMNLENNIINTKLKYGVKSMNKSGFMSNIRTSNTWNLYDKNGNELSNDNSLVTTSSSIRYSDTEYNIIIYGDIDKDGLITIKDLYLSYLLYKNKANLDEHQIKASDYNKDGSVNIKDIYEIYKKMKEK